MLAKIVNDNAGILDDRVAWTFFASKLAPTGTAPAPGAGLCSSACVPMSRWKRWAWTWPPTTPENPVGASLLAKVVNDNAGILDDRVAWTVFASKLAPTSAAPALGAGLCSSACVPMRRWKRWAWTWPPTTPENPVGASLLAKVVNDNAGILDDRVAWTVFASKLAPTGAAPALGAGLCVATGSPPGCFSACVPMSRDLAAYNP